MGDATAVEDYFQITFSFSVLQDKLFEAKDQFSGYVAGSLIGLYYFNFRGLLYKGYYASGPAIAASEICFASQKYRHTEVFHNADRD